MEIELNLHKCTRASWAQTLGIIVVVINVLVIPRVSLWAIAKAIGSITDREYYRSIRSRK